MKSIYDQFEDWVAKQTGEYNYTDCQGCAFATFLREITGADHVNVAGNEWLIDDGPWRRMPKWFVKALVKEPWTYEDLSRRLKTHMPMIKYEKRIKIPETA